MNETRAAIIGFGGIARTHYTAYYHLKKEGAPVRVVAVADQNAEQFKNVSAINLGGENVRLSEDIHTYTNVEELLRNEEFDMADICLPSFLHREYAVRLMQAEKHVLCEKPMALTVEDCEAMLCVAKETNRRLMIGQCLRFDPAYRYLKECVDSGRYGRLRFMTMDRLSEYPAWSVGSWFSDQEKCGGCIIDTHIHDIDMARFLLGDPKAISCVAYDNTPHCQWVNSRLFYDGATVIASGVWDEARPIPFYMGYDAKLENAAVTFDGMSVRVQKNGEEPVIVDLPEKDRIAEELRHFVELVRNPSMENTVNSAESAAKSLMLTKRLAVSAAEGGKKIQFV